jgi:hypothetical protein
MPMKTLQKVYILQNDRLESEQVYYIKNLLKQAKEFEKHLSEAEVVNKEQVIAIMMDKWATEKQEIKSIERKWAEDPGWNLSQSVSLCP